MFASATARLTVFDPGLVRARRGVRAVGATVLAWATMLTITAAFDVADPARITLFAAGAAFEGALLAPDPRPRDRVRTLGWAAVVCAAAVFATVQLTLVAAWLAAVALVILMFSSYALRPWSTRLAGLALMGAITVYITGGGHITVGRIGWFALAAAIGFGWLAIWESVILPEEPLHSLQRSVQAFALRTSAAVTGVVDVLNTVRDGAPSDRARKTLRADLDRVRACRAAIERQSPGAVVAGFGHAEADHLRVALHSVQKGLEDMAEQVDQPGWVRSLPDELGWSMTSTLHGLAVAVRDDRDEESRAIAARRTQVLRVHVHDALTQATTTEAAPFEPTTLLAALTLLGGGEVVAQSITRARTLTATIPESVSPVAAGEPASQSDRKSLSPSMALAIQAVVAALTAGVLARVIGNEQSLVVAWTAFVIIAGSAGLSTRRALVRIPATILGAVGGVLLAATVPDTLGWTIAVVAVGVFFTIVSAPVSYPAMVFWMSIAFVPLFATEGRYLDLIWDKTVAALIGGCIAGLVALTVVPIRSAREVRPAILSYLTALDAALASHLPGHEHEVAVAEAGLDSAHVAFAAMVTSAASETNLFAQAETATNDVTVRVDAVHEAYQRLTPLLSDSARLLHGWSDDQVARGIRRLREATERAESSARGEAGRSTDRDETAVDAADAAGLEVSDALRRVENLHATLTQLAQVLCSHAALPDATR
ncbi:FUSC family protein [Mycolicibacterium hodleri]|uniref:FUSC family protein n=1 Tax=Mycolicibacterium hodleri TaxID=49897 RepID=UPI001375C5E3|nr:FUSC family protein [Mycolicibacterium hodleri]